MTQQSTPQKPHFVCIGDCSAHETTPGICKAVNCPHEGNELVACTCTDNKHSTILSKKLK